MNRLLFLTANMPSVKGPFDYIQREGKYVLLILMFIAAFKYYKDEKWGKLTISGIAGGLLLFFIASPDTFANALKAIGGLFIPQ